MQSDRPNDRSALDVNHTDPQDSLVALQSHSPPMSARKVHWCQKPDSMGFGDIDPTEASTSSSMAPGSRGNGFKRRKLARHDSASSASSWGTDACEGYTSDETVLRDDNTIAEQGMIATLLELYGSKAKNRNRSKIKQRRWDNRALFATRSHEELGADRVPASPLELSSNPVVGSLPGSANSSTPILSTAAERHFARRDSPIHHFAPGEKRTRRLERENLDEPYIPSRPRAEAALRPPVSSTVTQSVRSAFARISTSITVDTGDHQTNQHRAFAPLIITTSSLAAPATPSLVHIAPASGKDAETSRGRRNLARYSNARETADQDASELADDARIEAMELGLSKEHEAQFNEKLAWMQRGLGEKLRKGKPKRGKREQRAIHITKQINDPEQRRKFLEHLAKALVKFGAPSHSIESWLETTAEVLEVDACFVYFPSVLLVAFRDVTARATETLFIRPKGNYLDLYRLSLVHDIYRAVVHDEISVSQGSRALRRVTKQTKPYPRWVFLLAAAVIAATAAKVAFSGSFVDMLMAAVLGTFLAFVQLYIMATHRIVTNIFEIGTAGLISFLARGLGGSGYFCYNAVASASIVLILPGWHLCLGALELGSRNIVSGAIRTVWAIIYTLFLSFALSTGSQIFDLTGISQPSASSTTSSGASLMTTTISGSFLSNDTSFDNIFQSGVFTFTNGTSSVATGTAACLRGTKMDNWWSGTVNDEWLILLVPLFSGALAIWNRADWRSSQVVVMIGVASAGYVVNYFMTQVLPSQPNVTSACAAFAIGLLGNMYSRLAGGSAFPSMVVGILLEVPNSIASAGGLSISSDESSVSSGSNISSAVLISIRLVESAIGLAVGLFASTLAVYPFGKRGYIFSF